MLSILIPTYNEQDSVRPLHDQLTEVLVPLGESHEIIFINDGSKDSTEERLNALAEQDEHVKVIHFRRNFGQTSALMAGIDSPIWSNER